jgi:hypothetical protein
MEIPEMIGWISLGFAPTYIALELGSRKLTRSVSAITSVKSERVTK